MPEIKIGALCWNQYTDWQSLLQAGIRADELGFDSLWTWGHGAPMHDGCRIDGLRRN